MSTTKIYPEHDYDDPDAIDAGMNCHQYSTVETPYLVACCKDYDDVTNSFELHSYDDTINLQNVRELACIIIICTYHLQATRTAPCTSISDQYYH